MAVTNRSATQPARHLLARGQHRFKLCNVHLLPSLLAALLLPVAQPLMMGATFFAGGMLFSQAPARAQTTEAVAKVAEAITVRIEGATPGSGVLIKRDGNRYTVLTAWHVVSGQRPGEELDIYTLDGQKHSLQQGSIKRLGEVDLAVLTFTSLSSYELAQIGDVKSVLMGSPIYVAGFPLATSAVATRPMRFLKGEVIANATAAIPNGYQLLYSNPTLPGMSGGAALNAQGQLVGIHGQGETDGKIGEQQDIAVKTGTNQAVPITYYNLLLLGSPIILSASVKFNADDYLAEAHDIVNSASAGRAITDPRVSDGAFRAALESVRKSLSISPSATGYFWLGVYGLRAGLSPQARYEALSTSIALNPRNTLAYSNRSLSLMQMGRVQEALTDLNTVVGIDSSDGISYRNRAVIRRIAGDVKGALADYGTAISLGLSDVDVYIETAGLKREAGDLVGALKDYDSALTINPRAAEALAWRGAIRVRFGDKPGGCEDMDKAAQLGNQAASLFVIKNCK
jgi:tetratricopeptide (TPR) repeat protein